MSENCTGMGIVLQDLIEVVETVGTGVFKIF